MRIASDFRAYIRRDPVDMRETIDGLSHRKNGAEFFWRMALSSQ